jgi:N-acetylmuramoyl-L-alanine amidase
MPNISGISGTNNNKDSKPRTKPVSLVVLTYSVSPDLEKTLITLNNRGASVHYIIEENGKQNQFTNDATDIRTCLYGLNK